MQTIKMQIAVTAPEMVIGLAPIRDKGTTSNCVIIHIKIAYSMAASNFNFNIEGNVFTNQKKKKVKEKAMK